jgi:hypothetical protein
MTPREQILEFFRHLDKRVDKSYTLTAVGGSAMVIGYGSDRATTDFDSLEQELSELEKLFIETSVDTGIKLGLDSPGAFVLLPEDYESRLEQQDLIY